MNRGEHSYSGATGFPPTPSPGHRKRHVICVQAEWLDWVATTYDTIL